MFGIAPDEMLLVVIVAIIVIGPKDLPLALRTAGRWIGKIRRVSGHFRTGIETMIREAEMEEMERKWKEQNAAIMAAHPAPDPAAGQTAEAATDQNDPPPLMTPLPAPVAAAIDPEVAAVAPTEPAAEPLGELLPIAERPARPRSSGSGSA
ncbi:preprotein translocase subunit TatB [Novosphingobium fuchskuhlense]|uniref:Preprotein translocase subunit TatB n=1 Tax=Novosphingobium fuchskuhlense TaxID=1117702 RepID=A0A117UST8_9SPHN|nr:Sec-independent protein translocase protein TatB [Novosphingobium fuchskuhlense]KUR70197.1 preprotein translocase subunit TatB [Novosphingobium fuchskuhlense]